MDVTFNGVSLSRAFGYPVFPVFIEHPPEIEIAEPDLSIEHVPGRNGDVIYDDGSYRNVTVTYEVSAHVPYDHVYRYSRRLSRWLYPSAAEMYTPPGNWPPGMFGYGDYFILQDDYIAGSWFRLARTVNVQAVRNINQKGVKWRIQFDCRPEKFFASGLVPQSFTNTSGTIDIEMSAANKMIMFPLKPMIAVTSTGTGAFAIYNSGGHLYRVSVNYTGTIFLDCETQEAMLEDGTSANEYVTITGVGTYPVIENDGMLFARTGDITSVLIYPRSYVL